MKYYYQVVTVFVILLLGVSPRLSAQFAIYDPDITSFTLRGDSFFVETEVVSLSRPRKIKPGDTRTYTWAFAGQIQSNQGGYAGRLLHGEYTSLNNVDHSLREQGMYWYGLKDKEWKYWSPNGKIKRTLTWKKGILHGDFADFDQDGYLVKYGQYKRGLLCGHIYYYEANKLSLIETYRRGVSVKSVKINDAKKDPHPVASFLKKLFKKKPSDVHKPAPPQTKTKR
jgi:hypothetical protein